MSVAGPGANGFANKEPHDDRLPRLNSRPMAASDWRVIRAFAGHLKKWVKSTLAISPCSGQARSCSVSPSAMRACGLTIPMRARSRDVAALNRWNRRYLERKTARLLEGDKTWYEERFPLLLVENHVGGSDQRFGRLSEPDRLDGAFSRGT